MANMSFSYGYSSVRQKEIELIKNKYINKEKTHMGIKEFFKKAFFDMKESAKAQHQVDKANFAAAKAESKAQWHEAKAMGNPKKRKEMMQAECDQQIKAANERIESANARYDSAKK